MLHTEVDMSQIPEGGELVDKGNYLVRISNVKDEDNEGNQLLAKSSGAPIVEFTCKIQEEGKWMGRPLFITASLQPHALFTLKAVYTAVGYNPGPEGHDPHECLDGEMYVNVDHDTYEGKPSMKIQASGIRSVSKGPLALRS